MSIDKFFRKQYDRQTYNCVHFACDVWEHETGDRIDHTVESLLLPPEQRKISSALRKRLRKIDKPVTPCIVLMQRRRAEPHVGIYIRGKVLHIHELGVEYMPLDIACRGFDRIGFYQ